MFIQNLEGSVVLMLSGVVSVQILFVFDDTFDNTFA